MNPQLSRWIKVMAMGLALGFTFVVINLALWALFDFREAHKSGRTAPFRLSADSTRRELSGVIGSQIAAIRKNDYPGAYTFAAENIRVQMSAAAFERMVKASYSAMARSQNAGFGVILDNDEEALVDVAIKDESGRELHYRYLLLHESAGWKIGGVTRVRVTGVAI